MVGLACVGVRVGADGAVVELGALVHANIGDVVVWSFDGVSVGVNVG